MGCNYYLKYKAELDLDVHNKYAESGEQVTTLDNGLVYKNHYYKDLKDLETSGDFSHLLHIGKSSCGWHFSLCIYPELGINNLSDWSELFDSNEIINEYGEIISKSEMIKCVTARHRNQADSKEEQARFCQQNSAEPGLNNLYAHKNTERFPHTRTEGTYDLTECWNFC